MPTYTRCGNDLRTNIFRYIRSCRGGRISRRDKKISSMDWRICYITNSIVTSKLISEPVLNFYTLFVMKSKLSRIGIVPLPAMD